MLFKTYSYQFWCLFAVASLLMFNFAYFQGTTVLYVAEKFTSDINISYKINAVFSALVYLSLIFSGFLTQRYLNSYFGLWLGFLFYGLGDLLTATPFFQSYCLGLVIFALGYGFLYTNTFYLLGKLYGAGDGRRESSFTLAYMGFNVGAIFAFLLGGFSLQEKLYQPATLIVGLFFVLLCVYAIIRHHKQLNLTELKPIKMFKLALITIFLLSLMWLCLIYADITEFYLSIFCLLALFSIFIFAFKERHKPTEYKKLMILGVLTLVTMAYWVVYKMQDNLFLYFFQHNVQRNIFGITIPTTTLLSINPLSILIFSPLVSYLWYKTGSRYNSPASKVALGLFVFAFSFCFFIIGVKLGMPVSLGFVIAFLISMSLSETIFGPGTISMVGQLAKSRYQRVLLGLVQLSPSLASIFSGQLAVALHDHFLLVATTRIKGYIHIFTVLPALLVVGALVAIVVKRACK